MFVHSLKNIATAPFRWPLRPRVILLSKAHQLGDAVMCTAVFRESKKVLGETALIVETRRPELFEGNPHPDEVRGWHLFSGSHTRRINVTLNRNAVEHLVVTMLKSTGLCPSEPDIRPELFLSAKERAWAREFLGGKKSAATISGCSVGRFPNREWGTENFQRVRDSFPELQFVQLSGRKALDNVLDGRATNARQAAALLRECVCFIGQEGGLMHLATSVGTPSVIVFGGCIRPERTGYPVNVNLFVDMSCSECLIRREPCDHRRCMKEIGPDRVVEAVRGIIGDAG